MQNLTPYFDFPPPNCLLTMILLEGSEEDSRVFTGETANLEQNQAKIFQVEIKIGQILVVFGGWGPVVQKVSIFTPKGTSLTESVSFKPFT